MNAELIIGIAGFALSAFAFVIAPNGVEAGLTGLAMFLFLFFILGAKKA